MAACPFGLGMPDFNRPGVVRVTDAYRQKQKHIDAHMIGATFEKYLVFPTTFEGKLPSESLGRPTARVKIGETYHFPDAAPGGITGIVTAATVQESTKQMFVGVTGTDGQSRMLRVPMSDADFAEYNQFRDAYFGQVQPAPRSLTTEFELFEWFMEAHKATPRATLLTWLSAARDRAELDKFGDEDLRMLYCEAMVASVQQTAGGLKGAPAAQA